MTRRIAALWLPAAALALVWAMAGCEPSVDEGLASADAERGFVLHTPATEWDSTLQITDDVSVTTSKDILEAIAKGEGPTKSLIALGYAGWGSGQLEAELSANAWLNGPATDKDIIFEMPSNQRWQAAASLLGVDLNLLSGEAGHA